MPAKSKQQFFQSYNKVFSEYRDRLEGLYGEMDARYDVVSSSYGFICSGCEDSCCESLFYHHTYAEYLYLLEGFFALSGEMHAAILEKAASICRMQAREATPGFRVMCPANHGGLCLVYAHRPMICRLHGISHELKKPGQSAVRGPGCPVFTRQCGDQVYRQFDRTPFYREMAQLEQEFRQAAGLSGKIRMTIAQMLDGH